MAAEAAVLLAAERPLTPGWLEEATAWIGDVAPSWQQLNGSVPPKRTYRQLVATPHLEAWLIVWPTDGHLELHDHGGASGAFQVVDGTLDERSLVAVSGPGAGMGEARPVVRDRVIPAGDVTSFDGWYIHDVRNTSAAAATSVHVYGPASRPIAFYRVEGRVVRALDAGAVV